MTAPLLTLLRRRTRTPYANRITSIMPANLAGYWQLAEASGSIANDASGHARHGTYIAVTLGQPGIGDGKTAASFDGTGGVNVYTAGLAGAFPGDKGTIGGWFKVANAGVWTDATARRLINFQSASSNLIRMIRTSANGIIQGTTIAGSVSKNVNTPAQDTLDWFHVLVTWDKAVDTMRFYLNGAQTGADQNALGIWAGALAATTTMIAATTTTPASAWAGSVAHVAVWNVMLTPAQCATIGVR